MLRSTKIRRDVESSGAVPSQAAVDGAISKLHGYFRGIQSDLGYWWGELESNNTMEAEYVMLSRFLGHHNPERERHIVNYLLSKQLADGSWSIYYGAPGDLSTSVECYFALKLCGEDPESDAMSRAREFILQRGGLPRVRVFTRIWFALFGQWDWEGTPRLPTEMMLLPDWAPLSIYRFASWARGCIVPLSIVLSKRPVRPIPPEQAIDELLPNGRAGTDYTLPKPPGFTLPRLMHIIDETLGKIYYRVKKFNPLTKAAEKRAIRWILEHQEDDGSWGGIQPPWVYSLIALSICGFPNDHPAIKRGFHGLDGFGIQKDDRWTIQGCISPVWDTCLVVQALAESGVSTDDPMLASATNWLVDKQILVGGDWQVQARQLQPGGWAFEFHNNCYPDIDDTAEVVLALRLGKLPDDKDFLRQQAIDRALDWVTGMQNRDGGWASFDKNNNHAYVTALTFSDFGEVLDPSSADVTAHVLEMYGKLGYKINTESLQSAYRYLRFEQEDNGSWFGRWGVNYVYGLGAVLPALEAIGEDMKQPYVRRAVQWLLDHQNDDGGWGESCASYVDIEQHGVGPSTASQTAWALMALIAAGDGDHPAAHRSVDYLLRTQQPDGHWEEPYFTGTGFPGYIKGERVSRVPKPGERGFQGMELSAGFMINYHLYRNTWPLLALARYRNRIYTEPQPCSQSATYESQKFLPQSRYQRRPAVD
ncbi:MAG: squalene--hopene cyclase [Chloroflexi bacterium]|nr:squalene--hopene cyclase [Chloroflexota bacterium]MYD47591.1 squalene--hopene cyclase [Chloroflexota bacterium]